MALLGGVMGVIFGISVAKVITAGHFVPIGGSIWSVVVSLFVSTAVGLFFGIYPAHKAAALDPITALRAEL
jgi:putative ABC transport system permease protein